MNPLLLAFVATGAAFLAGLGIGLMSYCQKSKQPRAAGPFDIAWRPETACAVEEEEPPLLI